MFEWAMEMINQATTLVRAAIVLLAIVMVVMVYARTRGQLVATAVAALMAGAVIWAVNNIDWFERKVGEETIAAGGAPVVLVEAAETVAGVLDPTAAGERLTSVIGQAAADARPAGTGSDTG